ncbi:unnamed protein product, partial [Iphiclides podalirius]
MFVISSAGENLPIRSVSNGCADIATSGSVSVRGFNGIPDPSARWARPRGELHVGASRNRGRALARGRGAADGGRWQMWETQKEAWDGMVGLGWMVLEGVGGGGGGSTRRRAAGLTGGNAGEVAVEGAGSRARVEVDGADGSTKRREVGRAGSVPFGFAGESTRPIAAWVAMGVRGRKGRAAAGGGAGGGAEEGARGFGGTTVTVTEGGEIDVGGGDCVCAR